MALPPHKFPIRAEDKTAAAFRSVMSGDIFPSNSAFSNTASSSRVRAYSALATAGIGGVNL